MMDVIWTVTAVVSAVTGVAGGLVFRQWIARLDHRRAERRR